MVVGVDTQERTHLRIQTLVVEDEGHLVQRAGRIELIGHPAKAQAGVVSHLGFGTRLKLLPIHVGAIARTRIADKPPPRPEPEERLKARDAGIVE